MSRVRPHATLNVLLALGVVTPASANPWTRDAGSFYANVGYSRISADRYYGPDKSGVDLGNTFTQQELSAYAEVGLISQRLMLTVDSTLYRRSHLSSQGYVHGLGDMRLGLWGGLLLSPLRISAGVIVGLPTGDSEPTADDGAAPGANLVARSLPTGDGETDIEGRLAMGHSFGGRGSVWPLQHYVRAEIGYWLHTDFADAFTYKAELGIKAPYKVIDRLWVILRFHGVESFASDAEAAAGFSGLGDGVTYNAYGLGLVVSVWRGISVGFDFEGAFRARSVPAAPSFKLSLSYER